MNKRLSQEEVQRLTSEFAHQDKSGVIGGYCESGFPLYCASEGMVALLGYESVDALAQAIHGQVSNTIHPDDLPQVLKDLGGHYYEGMTYETTYRMPRKDGSWFWAVAQGKVVSTEDGRLAIISLCTDMSSFLQRQKELETKSAVSDYLFQNLPGGYIRCSTGDGFPFLYLGERFLNMLGWTKEEIRTRFHNQFANLICPDDLQTTRDYIDRVLTDRLNRPYEDVIYRLLSKNGYLWISDTTVKVTVAGETFLHCIISDIRHFISEKEKGELELHRSVEAARERYEIIKALGSVYQELIVLDLQACSYLVVSSSSKTQKYQGLTGPLQEFQDFVLREVAVPEQLDTVREFLDFSTAAARLQSQEFIALEMESQEHTWYLVTLIVKKRSQTGEATHLLMSARQITEQKHKELQYQESLKAAAAEAHRANEAKTNFLRRISHDIRTPVNSVLGLIEMANRAKDDKEKLWEYQRKALSSLEYLLSIINNILDMGKVESGKIELDSTPFDLTELFTQNLPIVEMQANDCDVKCISEIRVQHTRLIGSPVHLNRILMNLTTNAIKYNRLGGTVTMRCVETPLDSTHALFHFTCADTGCGISREFQPHLFEPFSQEGKNSITTFSSSGLGLPIVKALTEQMHGTIHFESTEQVGTTFTVSIPFALDFTQHTASHKPNAELSSSAAGKRALLVDDNALNIDIAKMLLEDEGLTITCARNGQEAVQLFADSAPFQFDFIFMDIMMPILNGLDATRKIRALPRPDAKTVSIIAMSANAFLDDIQTSLASGMNAHLTKPLEAKRIHQTILQALSEQQEILRNLKIDVHG